VTEFGSRFLFVWPLSSVRAFRVFVRPRARRPNFPTPRLGRAGYLSAAAANRYIIFARDCDLLQHRTRQLRLKNRNLQYNRHAYATWATRVALGPFDAPGKERVRRFASQFSLGTALDALTSTCVRVHLRLRVGRGATENPPHVHGTRRPFELSEVDIMWRRTSTSGERTLDNVPRTCIFMRARENGPWNRFNREHYPNSRA